MLKRIGLLALVLSGSVAFVHPTAALAQDYRGWNGYAPEYYSQRPYRDDRFRDKRWEREWRAEQRRELRREREWRAHEWRERQRWENDWYPNRRPYRGYSY